MKKIFYFAPILFITQFCYPNGKDSLKQNLNLINYKKQAKLKAFKKVFSGPDWQHVTASGNFTDLNLVIGQDFQGSYSSALTIIQNQDYKSIDGHLVLRDYKDIEKMLIIGYDRENGEFGYLQAFDKQNAVVNNLIFQPHGGKVAIGKIDPDFDLDINGTIKSSSTAIFEDKVAIGSNVLPNSTLYIEGTLNTTGTANFQNSIAVGTSNFPQATLDISGTLQASGTTTLKNSFYQILNLTNLNPNNYIYFKGHYFGPDMSASSINTHGAFYSHYSPYYGTVTNYHRKGSNTIHQSPFVPTNNILEVNVFESADEPTYHYWGNISAQKIIRGYNMNGGRLTEGDVLVITNGAKDDEFYPPINSRLLTVGAKGVQIGGDFIKSGLDVNAKFNVLEKSSFNDQAFFKNQVAIGDQIFDDYMLSVKGKIIADRVVVKATPWADYVFEPEYNLRSLDSIEDFIKKFKHLPEVPTAKMVEENGNDLGSTQVILLKKIEELTLYIIELNKRVKQQEQKIMKLEASIK